MFEKVKNKRNFISGIDKTPFCILFELTVSLYFCFNCESNISSVPVMALLVVAPMGHLSFSNCFHFLFEIFFF